MLDTSTAQQLIQSSAELLAKTAQIEEDLKRLPAIEREKKEASDLAARLVTESSNQKQAFRARASQAADNLAKLGFRVDKANFVSSLESDPLGIFGVLEKIAGDTMVPQLGAPDPSHPATGPDEDPIYKFAMGG